MHTVLLLTWLVLPIAPVNPVKQDTIAAINLQITAGVATPNGVVSAGPVFSTKFEYRLLHPVILRGTFDFRFGNVGTQLWPDGAEGGGATVTYLRGRFQSYTLGTDLLVYRGTNHLTAYLGAGPVLTLYNFGATPATLQTLSRQYGIANVTMASRWGYRLTMGLRWNRTHTFEVAVTEIRPQFIYDRNYGGSVYSTTNERTRFGGFAFTFGHVLTLRQF